MISREVWNHVPGENNPADIASRGAIPSVLAASELWWKGPQQLLKTNQLSVNTETFDTTEEEKPTKLAVLTAAVENFELPKLSSFTKLKRVMAYIFIFSARCKKQRNNIEITVADLRHAERSIIKLIQKRAFANEINQLQDNRNINTKSNILQLSPFLDSDGILRVGGRLKNANVLYNAQHQILLPADSQISE